MHTDLSSTQICYGIGHTYRQVVLRAYLRTLHPVREGGQLGFLPSLGPEA